MSSVVLFSLVAFVFNFKCSFSDIIQNETLQIQNDHDFADFGTDFAGNFTANFSVVRSDLNNKIVDFRSEKLGNNDSLMKRSENPEEQLQHQKLATAVEFNTSKNISTEPKMLKDFRPSTPLETYYEYNRFPVSPAYPESKMVKNYGNVNAKDEKSFGEIESPISGNEKSKNLNTFEPGFSAFGNGNNQNSERSGNEQARRLANSHNGPPWASEQHRKNEDLPWVSRVRFPNNPGSNENPYPPISNTGADQNIHCCQETPRPNTPYQPNYGPGPTITNIEAPKNNFNIINSNKAGYLPTGPAFGPPKDSYLPPGYSATPPGEEFNFNKLVEVPKSYHGSSQHSSHHKTYETSYNLMEKPDDHHKTYDGGVYYNPWKKILKLFATFIPIGLLISALTPTVITVTNVNDTQNNNMNNNLGASRYRSNDDSKKELTYHILSSLDYFEKLNENGCEYRVFCELLVSASHMPNSKEQVQNLLDNFAKQETDYKSRAAELTKVFEAVKNHDCSAIPCEFIKNPT